MLLKLQSVTSKAGIKLFLGHGIQVSGNSGVQDRNAEVGEQSELGQKRKWITLPASVLPT